MGGRLLLGLFLGDAALLLDRGPRPGKAEAPPPPLQTAIFSRWLLLAASMESMASLPALTFSRSSMMACCTHNATNSALAASLCSPPKRPCPGTCRRAWRSKTRIRGAPHNLLFSCATVPGPPGSSTAVRGPSRAKTSSGAFKACALQKALSRSRDEIAKAQRRRGCRTSWRPRAR